jgi:tRNA(fMet)-specific endonuclease VapC
MIDTNVYVAFKRNDPIVVKLLRNLELIGFSVVVLGELLAGFALGTKELRNRQELDSFLDSPRVSIIPIGDEIAQFYAKIFKQLKEKGTPVPSNDIWIAASAMHQGLPLASFDGHFEYVDGLLTMPMKEET